MEERKTVLSEPELDELMKRDPLGGYAALHADLSVVAARFAAVERMFWEEGRSAGHSGGPVRDGPTRIRDVTGAHS